MGQERKRRVENSEGSINGAERNSPENPSCSTQNQNNKKIKIKHISGPYPPQQDD